MFLQQLINGLTLGGVYALVALGYTMVYGILELINFAHGEIYMLGAYLGILSLGVMTIWGWTQTAPLLSLVAAVLIAALYCGAAGATMERVAYRPLRRTHRLTPLISAIGVSIMLQNVVMLTQGSGDKAFPTIGGPPATYALGGATISGVQVAIMVVSAALMAGLHLLIRRTDLGLAMRATAQDPRMAGLVGINVNRVITATFVIGSALAAIAGVMVAMYYGVVNFFIGYVAGLKAFTAAVLGGIGNIPGAMLGGVVLGVAEGLGAGYISNEYKDVIAFVILIVVLLVRPTGLMGERVPEKV
ncbi:MAG: branched-chain amino acid ABC transporter permease [Nitrospirota bacterium]